MAKRPERIPGDPAKLCSVCGGWPALHNRPHAPLCEGCHAVAALAPTNHGEEVTR